MLSHEIEEASRWTSCRSGRQRRDRRRGSPATPGSTSSFGGKSLRGIRAAIVHFAPGARNAWHSHAVGQTLHVTEGVGRIQSRGEPPVEMQAGDTVLTRPGEWHWHGASPDRFMTHITVYETPAHGDETIWGNLVTDEEYLASPRVPDSRSASCGQLVPAAGPPSVTGASGLTGSIGADFSRHATEDPPQSPTKEASTGRSHPGRPG